MEHITTDDRLQSAIRITAPGTALRSALDMILAAGLGALICIGDADKVLASGNDGFPLNISFTANRLFELSKMDGAVVIDDSLNHILRANFHLMPNSSLPTSETGMRHRTASRMSMCTNALVISISERRSVVNLYIDGENYQLKDSAELINQANQLLIALQTGRSSLDRALARLSSLEFDNCVTLEDVTSVFARFQMLVETGRMLHDLLIQMGTHGRMLRIQLRDLTHGMDEQFNLMIRDYAKDSSYQNAEVIRAAFATLSSRDMTSPKKIAEILGFEHLKDDSRLRPLGLRILTRLAAINDETADKLVDHYGSLQDLMISIQDDPDNLGDIGVRDPAFLVESLYRMWGKRR